MLVDELLELELVLDVELDVLDVEELVELVLELVVEVVEVLVDVVDVLVEIPLDTIQDVGIHEHDDPVRCIRPNI